MCWVYPVLVQGPGAPQQIADAIRDLSENYPDVDTIITGRGGGSMEELWAFNEEIVARSIYESKIPVISAVGHETDFTIADFVADLRAETPTAAADLAVPDTGLIHEDLEFYRKEMWRSLGLLVEKKKRRIALCSMENFERDYPRTDRHGADAYRPYGRADETAAAGEGRKLPQQAGAFAGNRGSR